MRNLKTGFLFVLLCNCSFLKAQDWKLLEDSAKLFLRERDFNRALSYYSEVRTALKKDSFNTVLYANILHTSGTVYQNLRDYKNAESCYTEAMQIREKLLGKNSADFAQSCINLGILYRNLGQFKKAEKFLTEAKEIRAVVFGKAHTNYALVCNSLGLLYRTLNEFEKAESLILEAKQVWENSGEKKDASYASFINNLGMIYRDLGKYDKSERFYIDSKDLRESVLGKKHSDYAASCNNLAILYKVMGRYRDAEQFFREAGQIWESTLGKKHPDYAQYCNSLGGLYMNMGLFNKAETYMSEARDIRENNFGKLHPEYAASCNNLGILYYQTGNYEKAEKNYLEAKDIREKTLGKQHSEYASSCGNLASFYFLIGQLQKAEPLFIEGREVSAVISGKEHPDYAIGCYNLASFYLDIGQYQTAGELFLEARTALEKSVGKKHPDYMNSGMGLGNLSMKTGKLDASEKYFEEAKSGWNDLIGSMNADYARCCYKLGLLQHSRGNSSKAREYFEEAKEIFSQTIGTVNREYTQGCTGLANLYRQGKMYKEANSLFSEAFDNESAVLSKVFHFTSEKEKQSYLDIYEELSHDFISMFAFEQDEESNKIAYGVILANRNLILSSIQQLLHSMNAATDTSQIARYKEWKEIREQLAYWYTLPEKTRPGYMNELEEKSQVLEKELTRLSSEFGKLKTTDIRWSNIQQSLKPGEAAVEYYAFRYYNGNRWTDSTFYIALVLRNDKPYPELVRLFEQKELDGLLAYKATSAGQHHLNQLYSGNAGAVNLYDMIWKPLEKSLSGIDKIYFAPAGSLHKVSFAGLSISETNVLTDKYKMVQLSTTSGVVSPAEFRILAADRVAVFGGVQYDADSISISNAARKDHYYEVASRALPDDLERDGVPEFRYLVGTEKELLGIKSIGKSQKIQIEGMSGMSATEESFKSLSGKNSPAVLHIATHGFFFPDPKNNKKNDGQTSAAVFRQSDNPLIRSGLAFAGANNAWKGKPIKGVEDGILTAYEVSNMYLPNTKLAVLSACETGLGDIQGSEGVYGLQRAFKIAGVENLVMSLWKVPDAETAEFMQELYKNLFSGQTISDAFYGAQTAMKNKYRKEPYKWAAWVLIR